MLYTDIIKLAEDTILDIGGDSRHDMIKKSQFVIEKFRVSCERNRLILNMSKLFLIKFHFSNKKNQFALIIDEIQTTE